MQIDPFAQLKCAVCSTYLHGSVDGGVCTQAEVSSRDVVADGCWDDTHGDAELVVVTAGFIQLQNSFISLSEWQTEELKC